MPPEQEGTPQGDNRTYSQIDYDTEPEAWVRAVDYGMRQAYDRITSFADEFKVLDCMTGKYEGEFTFEASGELLSSPQLIQRYTQVVLDQGVDIVNVVDFGAGGASTLCEAALLLQQGTQQRKVNLVATNLFTTPTPEDVSILIPYIEYKHYAALQTALEEDLVDFEKANILELRDKMKGKPIHLMFMVNTLPATREFNDFVFQQVTGMLDPQYGTLILGHGKIGTSPYPETTAANWHSVKKGVRYLQDAGFRMKPEDRQFKQEEGLAYTLFQAPKAPAIRPPRQLV